MLFTPSPVIFSIFNIKFRWYGLAYAISLLIGFLLSKKKAINGDFGNQYIQQSDKLAENISLSIIIGIIIGGRLGYIILYGTDFYFRHKLEMFKIWKGGMSFHGGFIGASIAIMILCVRNRLSIYKVADTAVIPVCIGILFGRFANFMNGELLGKPIKSNVPWAIDFGDGILRHPSQLYEALFEGLFILIVVIMARNILRKIPGMTFIVFSLIYSIARAICEIFRLPDPQIGLLTNADISMGQLLSLIHLTFTILLSFFVLNKKKEQNARKSS